MICNINLFFQTLSQPCYTTELPSALKLPLDKPYATSKNDFIVTFSSSPIEPKLTVAVPHNYVPERAPSKVTCTPILKSLVPNQGIPNLTSFIPSSECPAPKVAATPEIALNPFVESSCTSTVPVSEPIPSKNTYTTIFTDSSLSSLQPEYTTNIIPSGAYMPTSAPISEPLYSEAKISSLYNVPPVIYQKTAQDNSLAMSLSNVLQLFVLDKILQRLSPTPCQNSISFDSNIYSSYSDNVPVTFKNNFNPYFVPQIENGVINTNSYKYIEEPTNFIPWNIDTPLPCSYIEDTPIYYDHNLISTNVYDISEEISNPYNNIQMIHNPIDTYSDSNVNAYPIMYENIAILPNTHVDTFPSELTDCINTDLPIEYEIAEGIISKSVTYDNSNGMYTHLDPIYEYVSPQSVETIEALPFTESSYNFINRNPIIYDFVSPIVTNPYNSPQLSLVSSQYPSSTYNEINSMPLYLELLMPSSIPLQLACICDIPRTLPELTLGIEPLFDCSYCEYM